MADETLTADLLRRANAAAAKAHEYNRRLTAAFNARYGQTYSDCDCDPLIDVLDYGFTGASDLTVAECDRLMAESGVFPTPKEDNPDGN